jgi:hypothetical protein
MSTVDKFQEPAAERFFFMPEKRVQYGKRAGGCEYRLFILLAF